MKISTAAFLLLVTALAGCAKATSTKNTKTTSTSTTETIVINDGTTSTVTNCSDGVARSGVTSCYYSNLPRLVLSGPATYGTTLWSSATGLPSSVSVNQFRTDASFSVRMKPTYAIANETSRQGRTCSPYLLSNFTKMKVYVMLRRSVDSIGEVKELTASVNAYSNTARFTVPGGTTEPYILEVIGVNTDHRCQASIYGSLTSVQSSQCTAGTLMLDIPYRTPTTAMTECVAFKMDMATDNTLDLPN